MVGRFRAWSYGKSDNRHPGRMRRTDFTWRVALLVHALHRAGISVLQACTAAEEWQFVRDHLGRRKPEADEGTEVDRTVRTYYYNFRKHHRDLDRELDLALGSYAEWCGWVLSADAKTLEFVHKQYEENNQSAMAKQFRDLVGRLQAEETFKPKDTHSRVQESIAVYESRIGELKSQLEAGNSHEGTPTISVLTMNVLKLARLCHEARLFPKAILAYNDARGLTADDLSLSPERRSQVVMWVDQQIERCNEPAPPLLYAMPYKPPTQAPPDAKSRTKSKQAKPIGRGNSPCAVR